MAAIAVEQQRAPVVRFEQRGAVALLTLDRPAARNAVDAGLARELDAALERFEADPELTVGVLAAEGPVFSAGADLKSIAAGEQGRIVEDRGFAGLTARARSKPLIAAVEGPALAGGFELVLACDLVVASTAARFGLPEVKRSLLAICGGLARLPLLVPRNVALELILTGEPLDAQRAHALGLVNRIVEPGEAVRVAQELALAIAANAPLAVRASRQVALTAVTDGEAAATSMGERLYAQIRATEDFREGPRAFAEKRPPRWVGR